MKTAPKKSPLRILLLGGTTEASALAEFLAGAPNVSATLSLAGRTTNPPASTLATRIGGFGGIAGLSHYLRDQKIDLLIDATHPFAARISANAVDACRACGVPLLAVERPPWTPVPGDDWIEHDTVETAIAALPAEAQSVFSGLGRQAIDALRLAPQHRYLIRVVDPIELPPDLWHCELLTARGPFRTGDDARLFADYDIRYVLSKNAGGSAAYAKIEAARQLGLKVHIVRRPALAARTTVQSADEAMAWISQHHRSRSDLGV
ncbi:cobalt-precorrin-6A reductase [Hyphomicrobium sp.]|uniref:cobalt-precorrin-6A reductase n=1 Tax=Hyphomicrobium sp. TaxID=82 RepID=UPI000F95F885|nr:cobalt-precorrin-6A reductase [Hyphomicrobium sp.]RUO99655.1 MAG: cobalt-precorrin-6A reductase [Hyphomicrobium sp.]